MVHPTAWASLDSQNRRNLVATRLILADLIKEGLKQIPAMPSEEGIVKLLLNMSPAPAPVKGEFRAGLRYRPRHADRFPQDPLSGSASITDDSPSGCTTGIQIFMVFSTRDKHLGEIVRNGFEVTTGQPGRPNAHELPSVFPDDGGACGTDCCCGCPSICGRLGRRC